MTMSIQTMSLNALYPALNDPRRYPNSAAMDKIRDLYLGQPIEQQSTFAKLIQSGTEGEELIAASQSCVAIAADPNAAIKAATDIRDIAIRWASRVESAVPDQGCA